MHCSIFNTKLEKKMDDILATFEDDNEFDWLSYSEFENYSINNESVNGEGSEVCVSTGNNSLNDVEIGEFIEKNKNINTAKKTKSDLNVWNRWCSSIGEAREIQNIPPSELDRLLCHFFINVRKQDGTEFEPGTLTSFQRSFGRHLRDVGKQYCLFNDKEFAKSRVTLESKRKQLRQQGKGRRPNKALELNQDEIEKIWSEKQLGDHCPEALIRTVWLNNTMHFGWRARDEHRRVLLGDLEVRREEGGEEREYIVWHTERGSKTRSGGKEFGPERYFNPRIYATGTERCPLKFFKSYLARRPTEMEKPDDPFYLAVKKNSTNHVWFKKQPLGIHSLGNFMKIMASAANLKGKRTNHSARRTMITTLRHENVNPLDISQLSGHKNLKSIDSYSTVSEEQQKKMSLLISKRSGGREAMKPVVCNTSQSSAWSCITTASTSQVASTSFSGAVFNHCTIVLGSKSPVPAAKRRRRVIESDDEDDN